MNNFPKGPNVDEQADFEAEAGDTQSSLEPVVSLDCPDTLEEPGQEEMYTLLLSSNLSKGSLAEITNETLGDLPEGHEQANRLQLAKYLVHKADTPALRSKMYAGFLIRVPRGEGCTYHEMDAQTLQYLKATAEKYGDPVSVLYGNFDPWDVLTADTNDGTDVNPATVLDYREQIDAMAEDVAPKVREEIMGSLLWLSRENGINLWKIILEIVPETELPEEFVLCGMDQIGMADYLGVVCGQPGLDRSKFYSVACKVFVADGSHENSTKRHLNSLAEELEDQEPFSGVPTYEEDQAAERAKEEGLGKMK